jgi:hypothetical protein
LRGSSGQEERDIAKFKGDWESVYTDFPELLGGNYAWADQFLIEADPNGYGRRRERQQGERSVRSGRPERGPTFDDLQKAVGSSARERQLYHAANGVVHGSWLTETLGSGKQDVMEAPRMPFGWA